MKKLLILITLIFANNAHTGFEPPVIIDPPNPKEGDIIRVGIFEEFYPPCLLLPRENSIGETHSFDFNNNTITLNVLAESLNLCNPIPFTPAPREYYSLGNLESGEYTITTIDYNTNGFAISDIPPFPLPDFWPSGQFGSTISFTVMGNPQVVEPLSSGGLLITASLFLLTLHIYRKNK